MSVLPTLIEFSPYFREHILGSYAAKLEEAYVKSGILAYLCILVSIIGVGLLGTVSAILSLAGAGVLLLYHFKYAIAERLGLSYGVPKLEEI